MKKINAKTLERWLFIILIIGMALYGLFRDSQAAERLIRAVTDFFSILIHANP